MKAICFEVTVSGYLRAKALERFWPSVMLGRLGTVALRELPDPELPGPEWVELEVLGANVHDLEPVLVIGSGTIALSVVWALRATGFSGEVIAQTEREHEARLAGSLGASGTVKPGAEAREALLATGAAAHKPIVGPEVHAGGGFPLIFDCVGNRSSLDRVLRFAAPRGRIVVLGCAASVPRLDLSWLWARELTVHGFVGYGREEWRGRTCHTFEVTREFLSESGAGVGELVTHTFALAGFRQALRAAGDHRRSGAIKVHVTP